MNNSNSSPDKVLAQNKRLITNIEKNKKKLEELKKKFENYNKTFNTISDSICLIDADANIILHNKATEKLLGKTEKEINGRKCYNLFHNSNIPIANCPINKLKHSHHKENIIVNRNNRWIEISVEPVAGETGEYNGIVHIVKDITEKREIEEKIRLSEEKFFKAFHLGPDVFFISKLKDGKLLEVNQEFCDITGLTREQTLGKTSIELNLWVNKNDREKYAQSLKENGKVKNFEFKFNIKDNKIGVGLLSADFITINNEPCILGIIHDITERKIIEEKIKAQNEEIQSQNEEYKQINKELSYAKLHAEESDKLKTAFLQNISHEIRTPMNGIMGFSELLLKPNLSEEKKKNYIDIIHVNCLGLLGIINDVIDISKIELGQVSLHLSNFNLNKLMNETYDFFKPSARIRNLELVCKNALPNIESNILADELKIKQILNNLINNSLKFTRSGKVEFGYMLSNNMLEFYVEDTGIGIEKEKYEQIFERFHQIENEIKESRIGIGLGLSISKALVNIMNGSINVESEFGKGSKFYFNIPYNRVLVESSIKEDVLVNIAKFNNKTILIVEDDDTNMAFLREILTDTGANIIETKSGKEAVEICKQNNSIDVVLMDVKLPDISGFEAVLQIRKFNKSINIIAQTAYAFIADRNKAFDVGCNDYFSKPIDSALLLKKIESIISA